MTRRKTLVQVSSLPVIALLSICALVLVTGGLARKRSNGRPTQINAPRLQNKTRSFEVIQIRNDKGPIELALKNGYNKNITAYAVSVNRLISEEDFLYSEGEDQSGIAPDAVHTARVGIARSRNPDVAAQQGLEIIVLAVVFDDRTSDGEPKLISDILNQRQGSKIQLTRIISLVNRALNSAAIVDDTVFDTLKSEISSLSTDSKNSTAESNRLRGEKDAALSHLDQLVHSDSQSARERISHFKQTCENLVARL